jgi:oligopeptidase B
MLRVLLLSFLFSAACGSTPVTTERPDEPDRDPDAEGPRPPIAKQVPHELTAHGHTRSDPYYWMRDDDRDDPEILAHLRAENEYSEAVLAPLADFRERLFQEIVARIPQDDTSVPSLEDGYWYYTRVEAGKEYPVYCRKEGSLDAPEQVILDANQRAQGHDYYDARAVHVSVDGRTMAWAEDTLSRRIYTIRFRDLTTGQDLPDVIEGAAPDLVWALDNRTIFYVKKEEGTLREYRVYRHELGTDAANDPLVYEERDAEFFVSLSRSRSREFVFVECYQTLSHEFFAIDARRPATPPRSVLPREENHEYFVDHANGRFYILTNWQARDFRLMSVEPRRSADKNAWREEIPLRAGVLLQDVELFQNFLVANERRDGISRLRVIPWARGGRANNDAAHDVAFDETAYTSSIGDNPEFRTDTLRLGYTSMTTPASVFDYRMDTRDRELKKQERVEGDFDRARYTTERIDARARDGTSVPISIVYRRDLDRSRPQPLLLYGYGSYGYSMDPTFSSPRLSLLDRGVIFAIAHVRGGQEFGRAWYEDGKLLHKLNTFQDFIDCAEHLVREGYTASDRLFANGASAGGLLMGAVANMRPDLFAAIVSDVPFVDVVTTMLDETIPLTTFEYDEWGNPNDEQYYRYMLSYSPYDNVSAQGYPHMLVLTGLHDSQVQYWEPAKWVARLRERRTDDRKMLFVVDMAAGHGGASGRFRRHRETALVYAFLLDLAGARE